MECVERLGPFKNIARKLVRTLSVDQVYPLIRIAHRQRGPLRVPQRIIFDHELVLILSGGATLDRVGESIALKPGTLLFLRPFEPHAFNPTTKDVEHLAVHFDFTRDAFPGAKDTQRRRPYRVQFTEGLSLPSVRQCGRGDLVADAFAELVRAREKAGATSSLVEVACLMRMLGALFASPTSAASSSETRNVIRVRRAVDYLHEHLAEQIDPGHLAEIADLSRSQFTRLFYEQTGATPMAYLRRARIAQARRLLADVDLSIKQIARRCGFADAYHFSRVFRQIDGLSPTLFRDAVLAGKSR